jgi:cyclic beta-1,2-glucan synthetase
VHGLPLMGSGDWNDGMNRVGIEGRGESVWLGWFLCAIVADFAPRARARGEVQRAQRWEQAALGWTAALNGTAWDGQWFKRAFFDDGQPLGSAANAEGRIDLIAQAWSVLSGVAPRSLQRMALAAADSLLVDQEAGLVKLLDPPLQHAQPSAGYIQAYPPGVRENGGQYTHAGVWALMAQARFQARMDPAAPAEVPDPDVAYRYFKYLSPAHRAQHATHGLAYAIEPYVVAGDVYTQAPYVGRGGWSWYTGAAAWLHRAAIESIFGLQFGARELSFTPCLPTHWPRAELSLTRNGRTMRFVFVRGDAQAALDLSRDELPGARLLQPATPLDWSRLPEHSVFVVPLLGAPSGPPESPETATSALQHLP